MKTQNRYRFQVWDHIRDQWFCVFEGNRNYCLGYLDGRKAIGLRQKARVWDTVTQKAIDLDTGRKEIPLGMIAGIPSPEQYEEAALTALEKARQIREMRRKREEREAKADV